jgi:hypothetical protein
VSDTVEVTAAGQKRKSSAAFLPGLIKSWWFALERFGGHEPIDCIGPSKIREWTSIGVEV